jgi:hypothetical protein
MVNVVKYTPILKSRAAEMGALSDLKTIQKDAVTPLLEFVPPQLSKKERDSGRNPFEKLMSESTTKIPDRILRSWGDGRAFFADFTLILPETMRGSFAEEFYRNAMLLHLDFIPVLNLTADSNSYKKYVVDLSRKYSSSRICIRINSVEIKDIDIVNSSLERFLLEYNHNRNHISLLIDLKEKVSMAAYNTAFQNIDRISSILDYSSLILSGGAFPKDMSEYKMDAEDNHESRIDWLGWRSHSDVLLRRTPGFADYTIRHPVYDESILHYRSSATIKYTQADKWCFYRGGVSKYEDYLANAALLREQPEFKKYGVDFSAGNRWIDEKGRYFVDYIKAKAKNPGKKIDGTGSTEQWLRAGINHHIAVVVDQLANLHD